MSIKQFMQKNFKHFNAAVCVDAAEGWSTHLAGGGKMLLTMAGAMSTAEIGISLAELIRRDKVHAICSTAANLEEDIFNLVAHTHYRRIPEYRTLSIETEIELREKGLNRVTDTCIPEEEAIRRIESHILELWQETEKAGTSHFPFEYMYKLIRSGILKQYYEIDPKNSWVVAACEKNLPIFTPGWEDSTLGNIFVAHVIAGDLKGYSALKHGLSQMELLVRWYQETSAKNSLGFFQIGGGIAGDFPICVVPLIRQDLEQEAKFWAYFCQISDSTTSFGSYSGAVPNEKITWGKLGRDSKSYIIESDASIVAPLIFSYLLEC